MPEAWGILLPAFLHQGGDYFTKLIAREVFRDEVFFPAGQAATAGLVVVYFGHAKKGNQAPVSGAFVE